MESVSKWLLTDAEKDTFIAALTPNLVLLRTRAGISQEELAGLIGVSRQTYSAMERKVRKMSWNTYLSLVLFYDYNQKTHQMIRSLAIFPQELVKRFNDGDDMLTVEISSFLGEGANNIIERLDEQALRSIRTMIMVEYARCTELPGDAVVKSFDGVDFNQSIMTENDIAAQKAIKAIKERQEK